MERYKLGHIRRELEMSTKMKMRRRGNTQTGMSLIELMIAMLVLAVGVLGVMVMISTAVTSNNRAKLDTSGTLLAQTVLEQISALPATSNQPLALTDCNPNGAQVWPITTAGAVAPGAGARINNNTGGIDWTEAFDQVPVGYRMRFVTCAGGGRQSTYEVRWNVRTINALSRLITVSARQIGAANPNQARLYAPPVTLRTIAGT
jgi:type IV pilus modification protein PilV